jgi:hypothetical protein
VSSDVTKAAIDFIGHFHVSNVNIDGHKYRDDVYMNVDAYYRQTAMNISFNVVDTCASPI